MGSNAANGMDKDGGSQSSMTSSICATTAVSKGGGKSLADVKNWRRRLEMAARAWAGGVAPDTVGKGEGFSE